MKQIMFRKDSDTFVITKDEETSQVWFDVDEPLADVLSNGRGATFVLTKDQAKELATRLLAWAEE